MKKLLDKINKVVFIAGMLAIVTLVLCVATIGNGTLNGLMNCVIITYLLIVGIFIIFAIIAFVMALLEGMKKDKIAFFKEFASNCVFILIGYVIIFAFDYFAEEKSTMLFHVPKMIVHILSMACAIVAGKYMISKHANE